MSAPRRKESYTVDNSERSGAPCQPLASAPALAGGVAPHGARTERARSPRHAADHSTLEG